MAVLDPRSNEIVIRVVYDGPPEAGKTTSLRALAGSLKQASVTPEEDATGRTLWFDWMEYVGGRFEGSQIRCQIISVPGQRALGARRTRLLAGADVVVSVLDSTPAGFVRSKEYLRDLESALEDPSVGVVLQANKRDVPDAVPLEEIREGLGSYGIGLVESVAADGTGIREAFVYAVRLALDRVRDRMMRGTLVVGSPELVSAEALLAALRGAEEVALPVVVASAPDSVAANALADVLDAEVPGIRVEPRPGHVPKPPDSSVPSGAIWPPVEGRAILYEVAQLGLSPHRLADGDWATGLGTGWRVVSKCDAVFASIDEGRAALIQWARLHVANQAVLSTHRCIVLAEAGDGSWRLWQIVRTEPSLRDIIQQAVDEATPELVVLRLCQNGKQLLDAAARISASTCDLSATLDSVGVTGGLAVYIGLMPSTIAEPRPFLAPSLLLHTQLATVVVPARIGERGRALKGVIERVPRPIADPDGIMATLVSLFA